MTTAIEPWRKWPTQGRAAEMVGVPLRKFRGMVSRGEVDFLKAPDSSFRFDPVVLEQLKNELADEEDDADEAIAKLPPSQQIEHSFVGAIKTLVDGLKQSQLHTQQVISLMVEPVRLQVEAQGLHIERMHAVVDKAFDQRTAAFEAMEKAKSEEHVRSTLESNTRASNDRKEKLMAMLKDGVSHLFPQGKIASAAALLESLKKTPQRLAALLAMKVLTPEEERHFRDALGLGNEPVTVTPDAPSSEPAGADIHPAGASSSANGKTEPAPAPDVIDVEGKEAPS